MKSKMLRILALVIVLSMIFTTFAFAEPGNNKFAGYNNFKGYYNFKGYSRGMYDGYKLSLEDYEDALKSLIKMEIVKGYGNGDYGLSGNVKRADIIVMIVRMLDNYGIIDQDDYDAEELGDNYLKFFEDVEWKEYYYGPIKIAKKFNIAKGDGKYFQPNKPVTIQEAIWLIERAKDLLDIDDINLNSDKIKALEEIYKGELNNFAKRRDIFWMLYFVLEDGDYDESEDDENEVTVIKYSLEADEDYVDFDAEDFTKALKNEVVGTLKYIMFKSGNEKLNYDYENEEKDITVNKTNKYYVTGEKGREISKITYVREDDSDKEIEIEYLSYYNDDGNVVSHPGLIRIVVEGNETVEDVIYTIIENKELQFNEKDFKKSIDKVKFELPSEKYGYLYYGDDLNNFTKITDKNKIYYDEELSKIIFIPKKNYTGSVSIKYTAYIDDETYSGIVAVNVLEKIDVENIDGISMDEDSSKTINFADNLKKKLSGTRFNDIDFVKFEKPEDGKLLILGKEVDNNKEYDINDLSSIIYESDDEGITEINYVAVNLDDYKAYTGIIEIDVAD